MNSCHRPCPCWTAPSDVYKAGDHQGHCCLLVDGHATPPVDSDWRGDDQACEPPHSADDALDHTSADSEEPAVQEPPC